MATASTGSFSVGDIASLVVAVLALLFAVGSFWWLNARSGRLTLATPRTFAYAGPPGTLRLRFPLSFYNTGAKDLIVEDLRVTSDDFPGPLRWITTRTTIKPHTEDGHEFAKPFAVRGRSTTEVIAEFGDDSWDWRPQPGSEHQVAIEGRLSQSADWKVITSLSWWAPVENPDVYITHRNEPTVT